MRDGCEDVRDMSAREAPRSAFRNIVASERARDGGERAGVRID